MKVGGNNDAEPVAFAGVCMVSTGFESPTGRRKGRSGQGFRRKDEPYEKQNGRGGRKADPAKPSRANDRYAPKGVRIVREAAVARMLNSGHEDT